jgi:hypothetical protein
VAPPRDPNDEDEAEDEDDRDVEEVPSFRTAQRPFLLQQIDH